MKIGQTNLPDGRSERSRNADRLAAMTEYVHRSKDPISVHRVRLTVDLIVI
jgi:hypothetical protein